MYQTGIVQKAPFGQMPDGTLVDIYTLRNGQGMEATIIPYGGIVTTLKVPDKNGQFDDVVLGHDTLAAYLANVHYFGGLIGRYGNRIAKGRFTLGGRSHKLATNHSLNHLHGGKRGFDKVVWTARLVKTAHGSGLELTYFSKDGEEGYPGNLEVVAVYVVTEENELLLEFTATTDQLTIVNLTHHSYFNLAGQGGGDIQGHVLFINADRMTPVDASLIPTGELKSVAGTPFDFRTPTIIGERINHPDPVLRADCGYDHNWVLNQSSREVALAARVLEPKSGRVMELLTTQPGLQFYTGNFLDGTIRGKGGFVYERRSGFCLEPQNYPDSPNHLHFPSAELKPGEVYQHTLVYKFATV
jgi:aldose 1-epimerase